MTDGPVLTGTELTRAFDGVDAIDGVSFELPPATILTVIGPNGSGKTTLLRLAAGLLSPDAGSITPSADELEPGYLPQHPSFRPRFTVRETVEFYARLGGVSADAVEGAIETVGLEAVADRRVAGLSGGMVRLLGVAQAIVADPPVVILDEPATGLDPGMRRRVFEAVAVRRDAGGGVLVASHDLELVEEHADRILLLDGGRSVANGSLAELTDRYGADGLDEVFATAVSGDLTTVARSGGSR